MGLVFKDASLTELEQAIRRVAAGETYFGEYLKNDLIATLIRKTRVGRIPGQKDGKQLSGREIEIIRLLCRGLSTKEIACDLRISTNTVETHKKNILNKLHLATIIDLLKYAIKNEIISL
ncbi:MAG TPA: response regulator transcription factor [Spirochaetia bacterium]|nr:response regulator transcription factor [Spirochaetia bacterium]